MSVVEFMQVMKSVSLENVFNPYNQRCEEYDRFDAADIRSSLLERVLASACKQEVCSIWLGRDLGYNGGRRTGLAFTDEPHLHVHASRWGVSSKRATKGTEVRERTASYIWKELSKLDGHIFLWNAFPFHPHEEKNQLSNRLHSASEARVGIEILDLLVDLLKPKQIVAVGNDAHLMAQKINKNILVHKVRHPSYGGHNKFASQIIALRNS